MTEEFLSGLIGAVVGALVGFIASLLTLRFNYHQLYAETVSSNRMEWINVWRENISKFLSRAEMIHTTPECKSNEKKILEYRREMLEAQLMIISRLNTDEEIHILMYGAIVGIDVSPSNANFNEQKVCIIELARKILKPEWERVKAEARGKKRWKRKV